MNGTAPTTKGMEERAWKLFALVPMMLLHRLQVTGRVGRDEGRDEFAARGDLFTRGQWVGVDGCCIEGGSHRVRETGSVD